MYQGHITEQPRVYFRKRTWQDGLFDCTNDCETCCCVLCCCPCRMCQMYRRYNEYFCTPFCMFAPTLTLRAYHRGKHQIEDTLCCDCVKSYFCACCATCQLDRDMKYIENSGSVLDI